jgi:hypothetical protein
LAWLSPSRIEWKWFDTGNFSKASGDISLLEMLHELPIFPRRGDFFVPFQFGDFAKRALCLPTLGESSSSVISTAKIDTPRSIEMERHFPTYDFSKCGKRSDLIKQRILQWPIHIGVF